MKIELEIPKEFEEHFKQDKFKDSLEKIMVDIWHLLENKNCLCANNYEYETIKMLEEALENSKSAYDVCEWRKFKGNVCLFETSCGNVSGMYRGFNFCPYCGKKIKIVE